MPIYEYRCAKCGHAMEVLENVGASHKHTCAKCGARQMEKMISTFGVGSTTASSGSSCPTGTCPLS